MSRFLFYIFLVFLLGLVVAFRLSIKNEVKIPRNQFVVVEATLKQEPRMTEFGQILSIGDAKVYVERWGEYQVGDKLRIEGFVDESGKIFNGKTEVVASSRSLVVSLRNKISVNIGRMLPSREATLILGSVLGVDDISRDFRDQLTRTGTIHVVVVSGQNLAIVAGIFLSLSKYLGRKPSMLLAVLACLFYALLAGFEPPVVRATIMVLASTLAVYFGREVNTILSIFLAALLILFFAPQAVGEISFQLTFAATLGIATMGKRLLNFAGPVIGFPPADTRSDLKSGHKGYDQAELRVDGIPSTGATRTDASTRVTLAFRATSFLFSFFWQSGAVAISAFLFTAPIIMFYFGRISVLSPLVNILVVEAVLPVMVLGFGLAIFSLVLPPLAQVLAYLAYVPAFYFVKVVEIFAVVPFGQIEAGKGSLTVVIVWYVLLLGMMGVWRNKRKL